MTVGDHRVRQAHHIVRVVDTLQIPLAGNSNLDDLRRWLYPKLGGNLAGKVVPEGTEVAWGKGDHRIQVSYLRQRLHRNKVELQCPSRLGVDVDLNIGVGHVDPHHLRVRRGDGLDRNPVILGLVDHLDPVGHVGRGISEVGTVVNQDGTIRYQVTRRAKGAKDRVGRPCQHLILGGEDRQSFRRPTGQHLVHGEQAVIGRVIANRFAFSQLAYQSQRPFNKLLGCIAHASPLLLFWWPTSPSHFQFIHNGSRIIVIGWRIGIIAHPSVFLITTGFQFRDSHFGAVSGVSKVDVVHS